LSVWGLPSEWRTKRLKRRPRQRALAWLASLAGALALSAAAAMPTDALPEVLSLKLFNIHTQVEGTFVFKRNGVYDQQGLAQLNEFLRDWRLDQPTHMDPHLFDLLYQVYKESGSSDYIHVVCGYRTPDTNAMLRRRSKLVAEHSLHMQGKAMDFFIPDVPLAKLRVIGMRLQSGGVGFYPTSGSPFVHMDTGNVRHWPQMTREELIAAFPDGRTLDIPTDGKPLPGYAEALADYQARQAKGGALADYAVASNAQPVVMTSAQVAAADAKADRTGGDDGPIQIAQIAQSDETDDNIPDTAPAKAAAAQPDVHKAVAIASVAAAPTVPMPHLAPHATPAPVVVAAAAPQPARETAPAAPRPPFDIATLAAPAPAAPAPAVSTPRPALPFVLASAGGLSLGQPANASVNFNAQDWSEPAVPADLARAMAARDQVRRDASLPIMPTSVVATIDVNRPLRAEAITTAVLRTSTDVPPLNPGVLAYAEPGLTTADSAPAPLVPISIHRAAMTTAGVPLPQLRPSGNAVAPAAPRVATLRVVRPHMEAPPLTMTVLDTQGLRLWMNSQSTRQKAYALLTMPDFAQSPNLMTPPSITFGAGFGPAPYADLRTDRFAGPLVEQPAMIDVSGDSEVASIQ